MKGIKYEKGQYVQPIFNKTQICIVKKVKRVTLLVTPLNWDNEQKKYDKIDFLTYEEDKRKFQPLSGTG